METTKSIWDAAVVQFKSTFPAIADRMVNGEAVAFGVYSARFIGAAEARIVAEGPAYAQLTLLVTMQKWLQFANEARSQGII